MKRAALIVMLSLAILPAAAAQNARDGGGLLPMGQPADVGNQGTPAAFKYLHFLAGLSLGLSAAQLVQGMLPAGFPADSPWFLPLVAVSASAVAGVGKEVLDSTGFGDPRFSDVVVTTIGGLAAAGIIAYAQTLYPPTVQGRMNGGVFVLSTAGLLALPVIVGFAREVASYVERRRRASASLPDPSPADPFPPR